MATMCRHDDDPEIISQTSGRAIPDIEVLVVDEKGNEVPRGESGEIVIRGYVVMPGYFENPEATAEAIDAEGWLHTGDIGVMDDAGNLRITDRIKDMFIVGGFNAYPAEIENVITAPPGREPGGRGGRARRSHGRGRHGLRGAAPGRDADRGRTGGVVPRGDGQLQGPPPRALPSTRSR